MASPYTEYVARGLDEDAVAVSAGYSAYHPRYAEAGEEPAQAAPSRQSAEQKPQQEQQQPQQKPADEQPYKLASGYGAYHVDGDGYQYRQYQAAPAGAAGGAGGVEQHNYFAQAAGSAPAAGGAGGAGAAAQSTPYSGYVEHQLDVKDPAPAQPPQQQQQQQQQPQARAQPAAVTQASQDEAAVKEHARLLQGLAKWKDRDWNKEYQELLDGLAGESDPQKKSRAIVSLHFLGADFSTAAKTVGRIIISEAALPAKQKTIPPVDAGGVAGGEKFATHGMFVKRVFDTHGIYGSDESAMKSAAHELKGARAYLQVDPEFKLRTPLMTVVDFRGFRVIATALLPIGRGTLSYGSCDAGKTVQCDAKVARLMAASGQKLGLKPHLVGTAKQPGSNEGLEELVGPCDIEVHSGKDGRFYLLDSARVFPPQQPENELYGVIIPVDASKPYQFVGLPARPELFQEELKRTLGPLCDPPTEVHPAEPLVLRLSHYGGGYSFMCSTGEGPFNQRASTVAVAEIKGPAIFVRRRAAQVFYALLRPEFVRSYAAEKKTPLSSDAFTVFGAHDHALHNREVSLACDYLKRSLIKQLADDILMQKVYVANGRELCDEMHRRGINVRYLGTVHCALWRGKSGVWHTAREREMVLTEMVVRVVKNAVRRELRQVKAVDVTAVYEIIIRFLNILFGKSVASNTFWGGWCLASMIEKFGQVFALDHYAMLLEENNNRPLNTRALINDSLLFQALQQRIGFRLNNAVNSAFIKDKTQFWVVYPFKVQDIETVAPIDTPIGWTFQDVEDRLRQLQLSSKGGSKAPTAADAHLSLQREITEMLETKLPKGDPEVAQARILLASAILERVDEEQKSGGTPTVDGPGGAELSKALALFEPAWAQLQPRMAINDTFCGCIYLHARLLLACKQYGRAKKMFFDLQSHLCDAYGELGYSHRDLGMGTMEYSGRTQTISTGTVMSLLALHRVVQCCELEKTPIDKEPLMGDMMIQKLVGGGLAVSKAPSAECVFKVFGKDPALLAYMATKLRRQSVDELLTGYCTAGATVPTIAMLCDSTFYSKPKAVQEQLVAELRIKQDLAWIREFDRWKDLPTLWHSQHLLLLGDKASSASPASDDPLAIPLPVTTPGSLPKLAVPSWFKLVDQTDLTNNSWNRLPAGTWLRNRMISGQVTASSRREMVLYNEECSVSVVNKIATIARVSFDTQGKVMSYQEAPWPAGGAYKMEKLTEQKAFIIDGKELLCDTILTSGGEGGSTWTCSVYYPAAEGVSTVRPIASRLDSTTVVGNITYLTANCAWISTFDCQHILNGKPVPCAEYKTITKSSMMTQLMYQAELINNSAGVPSAQLRSLSTSRAGAVDFVSETITEVIEAGVFSAEELAKWVKDRKAHAPVPIKY